MSLQEFILIALLALALGYVAYRVYRTYTGKAGDAHCDDCAANTLRDKKRAGNKQKRPS